jgi:hypothetical protein
VTGGDERPAEGAFNLRIDQSGGSCARLGTPEADGATLDAQSCGSMQDAVAACRPGDTILMKKGEYSAQTITTSRTRPGCRLVGERAAGANGVTVASLQPDGDWVEIENVDSKGGLAYEDEAPGTPSNITFRNVNFRGRWFIDDCCRDLTMIGGSIKDVQDDGNPASVMLQGTTGATGIDGLLFDGVEFSGHDCSSAPDNHYEVIRIQGFAADITIRNSYLHDNGVNTAPIFLTTFTGGAPHTPGPVTIEGNYFGSIVAPSGCNRTAAFPQIAGNMQDGPCPELLIRNNTAVSSLGAAPLDSNGWACSSGTADVRVTGNIAPKSPGGCDGTRSHNIWIDAADSNCGPGDQTVASIGESGLIDDGFHIRDGSPALDAGGDRCPAFDRDGDRRPRGAACDAGADEAG